MTPTTLPAAGWLLLGALVLLTVAIYVMPVVRTVRDRFANSRTIRSAGYLAGGGVLWQTAASGYLSAVVLLIVGGVGIWWVSARRSSATIQRWAGRERRKQGVASLWDIWRFGSWWALYRTAAIVQPSLAELRWWELPLRVRPRQLGINLGRAGLFSVHASHEEVTIAVGAPRSGKSGWLSGGPTLDHQGAMLVASSRTDLYDHTWRLRAEIRIRRWRSWWYRVVKRVSRPVLVFNAAGLAGVPSSVTFDVLTGCEDPVTAMLRSADMLAACGDGGREHQRWVEQAVRLFGPLLHAAAIAQRPIDDVAHWLSDLKAAKARILFYLDASPEPGFRTQIETFANLNDRTLTSITGTALPALAWLTNPAARTAAQPGAGFDVEWFLAMSATIYLLGAREGNTAALMAALTAHIAREARRLAALQPNGRLDPPLALRLDEAARIAPVPLEDWTADMGGAGINIVACFQSLAQVRAQWGEDGAAVIMNNAANLLIFGGFRDRKDLEYWSSLLGDREQLTPSFDANGTVSGRSYKTVPVFPPSRLAAMPRKHAVLVRRGMLPVIVRPKMAWRRWDVLAARALRLLKPVVAMVRRDRVAVGRPVDTWATDGRDPVDTSTGRRAA